MRTVTLIVNPAAGRARLLEAQMPAIKALLFEHGYAAEVVETSSGDGSARELAAAAALTSELVLACGGDGTVHGVVQGLACTDAVLGVVPLGTANALARNLGLPLDPLAAVAQLMSYQPRRIPVGEIETATATRWFVVMAGCGPDGMLVHELSKSGRARLKARFGRAAYYAHAARLFFTRRWRDFRVEYREAEVWTGIDVIAMMAARVADLGGVFSGTTRRTQLKHAGLADGRLQVQVLRGPGWMSLPAWMLCGWLGLRNPWLRTVDVEELRCWGTGVYAQADAEGMGKLPISLRVRPDALWVLMRDEG